ncbi:LacI family transcription regulator [Pseudomonas aeruginosa VRFPA03]|nr:LacI family transcription regulator [Pseudomonas aeruginosa VRFPA03]
MATMKDVAAMAGVSFTTVSHVVNRTRPVSDAVRKKVEDAIAQLHYVPSAVARSLKVRTTSIIGLLVPNSTNPYFAELSRGIEDCCERNGYCVILCNSDDNPQKQANYLRVLQEKRIDGLVLASAGGDGALAKGLANMRTPTVIVDREVEGVEADRVQIDHEMGAYLATRHLLELGHRDIACIGGPLSTKVSTLRVEGYRRAMAKAGLEVRPQWLLESEFSSPGGYHAALGLLGGEGERPTAIARRGGGDPLRPGRRGDLGDPPRRADLDPLARGSRAGARWRGLRGTVPLLPADNACGVIRPAQLGEDRSQAHASLRGVRHAQARTVAPQK